VLHGTFNRAAGSLLSGVFTLSLFGCGGSNPWETVYPATGVLTFKGKPLADAEISLFPVDATAPDGGRRVCRMDL
jgi:hypothetical protein